MDIVVNFTWGLNEMSIDSVYLARTLELARIRRGFCSPNPSVGSVVVKNNQIISEGFHSGPGFPHAEIVALNKLSAEEKRGATVYISLEPCCHFGRTPPCTDALIDAKVNRVVYGFRDPNPIVAGKGEALLTSAGIICEHQPQTAIDEFYQSYTYWHQTKKPFITAKIALSLDGKIAGIANQPIQITGNALQAFTHQSRKASDAILTTAKTILFDNPRLNARIGEEVFAKPVYILDTHLSIAESAQIFQTASQVTLFHSAQASSDRLKRFNELGIRCIQIATEQNYLSLPQIVEHICQDGIHDLWIEAGGTCFSSCLEKKLLQKAYIYIAPRWLAQGTSAFPNHVSFDLTEYVVRCEQVGQDMLCELRFD